MTAICVCTYLAGTRVRGDVNNMHIRGAGPFVRAWRKRANDVAARNVACAPTATFLAEVHDLLAFFTQCVAKQPQDRPSVLEVVAKLQCYRVAP